MPQKKPTIVIVAAILPNLGIGYKNQMPWRLSKEMKYFKTITSKTTNINKKNAVVMGRKTWESIPAKFRPLNDRINVVISSNPKLELPDNTVVHNEIKLAIDYLNAQDEIENIFIIGGSQIYASTVDLADKILMTLIEPKQGVEVDTFMTVPKEFQRQPVDKLSQLVGPQEENVQEKGFTYNYTLWERSNV